MRATINGRWLGLVEYDWPNARYQEHFEFGGDGAELHGSASFLGVARGLLDGQADRDGLRFTTRTGETGGSDQLHRYRGRLVGDEILFVMQTEGGSSAHVPVEFRLRRVAGPR